MADRTLFPHAFWLRTPAPLWTAPAFDRCLFLAFIYPVATIFVIWAVSGHVGPAEAALGMKVNRSGWERSLAAAGVVLPMLAARRYAQTLRKQTINRVVPPTLKTYFFGLLRFLGIEGWKITLSIFAVVGILIGVAFVAGPIVFFAAIVIAIVFSVSELGAFGVGAYAGAGSFGLIMVLFLVTAVGVANVADHAIFVGEVVVMFVVANAGFALLRRRTGTHRWQGAFFSVFLPGMILTYLSAAHVLSPLRDWGLSGPVLLFLGLLTVLNTSFDWASLGVTRALLRRGLELGGWWPYALALVDAGLAAVIIAALALTMVVGVQTFDAMAVHGGGSPVLPLERLFDGIAAQPTAPEYWWLYVVLLSTMIPSLVNLVIGGTSLMRGLPGLPLLLLQKVPARGNVPKFDRAWIAAVLTAQVATGAALGIAAQAFLAVVIIGYVMPFFGLELLDMARDVTAFNLPARVGHLFGVIL